MTEATETMRRISDWLNQYGWTARWNHKNSDGYETFHGNTNAKPDVLLSKNGYNVLVETKPCEKHKDLLDGIDQLLEYAGHYWTGRTVYTKEKPGEPIPIHGFVLGTNYSRHGYIYQEEDEHGFIEGTWLAENHNMKERPITHSATRILWRQWEKGLAKKHYEEFRKGDAGPNTNPPKKPKVGVLLSKIEKTTHQVTGAPYFYLNSNEFVPAEKERIYAFD